MARQGRGRVTTVTPQCPDGHGKVYESTVTQGRYFCVHVAHNGRPVSHPDGPAPQTRKFFTEEEVWRAL